MMSSSESSPSTGELLDDILSGPEDGHNISSPIPSPRRQLQIVRDLSDEADAMPIEAGSVWYLVGAGWFRGWVRWCQHPQTSQAAPQDSFPPISNEDIIDSDNFHLNPDLVGIKEGLREERDYFVFSERAFDLLTSWYGVAEDTLIIRRYAYEYAKGETRIETDLARIRFSLDGSVVSLQISHASKMADLEEAINAYLNYESEQKTKYYICFGMSEASEPDDCYFLNEEVLDKSLDEVGLLLPESYVWASPVPFEGCKSFSDRLKNVSDPICLQQGAGLVGLRNLGNTCFMNSSLQCLSNCEALRDFFLSSDWNSDINRTNRLGTGGALVEEFARLIRDIWSSPEYSVVDPISFKYCLGRFEGRFLGYHQQDSQEFLSALLDRVHEDLNRIKQKPYIEAPDRDGRSDDEVSAESWSNHLARNNSKIVDLFHGQLRSTVTCPTCSNVSVTFDPFMFLSLPIPVKKPKTYRVLIVSEEYLDEVDIIVPKPDRTIGGLKRAIKARLNRPYHSVDIVEVYNHDIYKFCLDDEESLLNIKPTDQIHAYVFPEEVPKAWITFTSGVNFVKIGFPVLIPTETNCLTDLVRFAQNPRLESDDRLQLVPHQRHKSDGKPLLRLNIPLDFLDAFKDTGHNLSEDDLLLSAFYHLFFPHHRRLPYQSSQAIREEVGLYECLDMFVKAEQLSPSESWYCSKCKDHQEAATKKFDLWRLPEILVIHLKRFSYHSLYGHKISTPVAFPINDLNMEGRSEGGSSSSHYELFAISDHFGGLGGGHYTAMAKNPIDEQWYHFDDNSVRPLPSEEALHRSRSSAYMLFYRRKPAQQ